MIFLLLRTGQGMTFFVLEFFFFFFGLVQITFLLQSSGQSENFFTLNCLSGCKRYFITEYWAGQGLLDHPEIFVRM